MRARNSRLRWLSVSLALCAVLAVGCGKYGRPVRVYSEKQEPTRTSEPAPQADAQAPTDSEEKDEESDPKSQP